MDNASAPQLRPDDLYKKRLARDSARLRAYNQILGQIHHRIRTVSTLPNNPPSYILYTIPGFILGLPLIDLEDCVVYLVYQLRTQGFEVKYSYPNLLNIAWGHSERTYLLEQSPILKAMLDAKEAANRAAKSTDKKMKKISSIMGGTGSMSGAAAGASGMGNNVVVTNDAVVSGKSKKVRVGSTGSKNVSFSPSPGAVATVLSAKDYVPPMSFMENLEKPLG